LLEFLRAEARRSQRTQKGKLPNMRNIVLYDILIHSDECHFFGKCICDQKTVKGVSVNHWQSFENGKVNCFLHIVLEILKRFVKIRCHFELPFGTTEYRDFFSLCLYRSKSKYSFPRRHFAGNINGQPVTGGYIHSLSNAHRTSIHPFSRCVERNCE